MEDTNRISIKEVQVKSIFAKTKLPASDYVINPYIGCMHGCGYCYARFMKKFTGHDNDEWGKFVDIKTNALDLIPEKIEKYQNKSIVIGSVTDPYQPIENKYQLTRKILERLLEFDSRISLMTKSDLVIRDIDILKQFKNFTVIITIAFANNELLQKMEKYSASIERRIKSLALLKQAGIKTVLFVSPIFPELTDWTTLIEMAKDYVDEVWFENLNFYFYIRNNVFKFLRSIDSALVKKYLEIYSPKSDYWQIEQNKIVDFCKQNQITFNICFHGYQ